MGRSFLKSETKTHINKHTKYFKKIIFKILPKMAAFYVYEHPCFTLDPMSMALESRLIPEEYFSQRQCRMNSQNILSKMAREAKKQAQLEQFQQNYYEAINDFLEDITDDSESEENNSENMEEECHIENNAKNVNDSEKETEITVMQPEKKLETKNEEEKIIKNHSMMTKVMVKEDLEQMDINVVNGCVATLVVKAEDGDQKFERQFKLPYETSIDKIDSKFFYKKEDKQTLQITIPKDVKIVQLPISMEEDHQ